MTDAREDDPRWQQSWAGDLVRNGAPAIPVAAPPIKCSVRSERWVDMDVLVLDFPADAWKPNEFLDDPTANLRGPTLVLNGLPMHMEAWAVDYDSNGMQQPNAEYEEEFEKFHEAVHADGSFSTIEVGGREYIVLCHPHC